VEELRRASAVRAPGHGVSPAGLALPAHSAPGDQDSKPTRARSRVLVGRRVDGVVRVYDGPARPGSANTFLVEPGLRSKAELAAVRADYRRRAVRGYLDSSRLEGEARMNG
jgi:hypothetical protein